MKKYRRLTRKSISRLPKAVWLLAMLAIAVLLALGFRSHKRVTTVIPSSNPASSTSTPSQKNAAPSQQTPSSSSSSPPKSNSSSAATAIAGPISAPFGEFVSNHSPSLSSTALSQEYSVCDTTPGASCYIKFTMDYTTRQLAAKFTDSSGTTSWQWDIHDANLTTGNWTIIAVASSNSDTKSTQDNIPLSVQP